MSPPLIPDFLPNSSVMSQVLCFTICKPFKSQWRTPSAALGLFQKKSKQGELRIYLSEPPPPPGIFRFVTLSLEILEKKSFHPWKF